MDSTIIIRNMDSIKKKNIWSKKKEIQKFKKLIDCYSRKSKRLGKDQDNYQEKVK